MRNYVIRLIKSNIHWLEGSEKMRNDAMTDIIAESYMAFGECDELDGIFRGIGWIDEDGDTIFENCANYKLLIN